MKQTKGLCWKTVLSWHAVSSWKVVTYEDMLHDLWRCAVLSWPMKLTNLLSWPALLFDMMYSLWKLYYFEMLLHSNANRLFLCVISLIHTCGMTDSHVWHDEFTRVTWRIQTCDLIHSHVWHDAFKRVIWFIRTCDMTDWHVWDLRRQWHDYSHVWHVSVIREIHLGTLKRPEIAPFLLIPEFLKADGLSIEQIALVAHFLL